MRILLLGSGELGREVALEAARLGVEVVAADRYDDAPAMRVTPHRRVLDMTDPVALRALVEQVRPDLVVPEVEALATEELLALEAEGFRVVPTARAARLTMDREGIRRLAAEELGLATSPYRFASTEREFLEAVEQVGRPCVVKPVMSSSGKGQSTVGAEGDASAAWVYARDNARVKGQNVIVEGFVDFAYEVTLLTVRHAAGVTVCPPVGHVQVDGDYRESWQPMPMSLRAWDKAQLLAWTVVRNLGGFGIFGVELFVKGDEVLFSEVSPRPHDTGLVTLGSQNYSEFALHVRAILGLPVPAIHLLRPSASVPLLGDGNGIPRFEGLEKALAIPESQVRLFGKPNCEGHRRLAVAIASADTVEEARRRAKAMAASIEIHLD